MLTIVTGMELNHEILNAEIVSKLVKSFLPFFPRLLFKFKL